jgi:DNA polymerase delta subunit 3
VEEEEETEEDFEMDLDDVGLAPVPKPKAKRKPKKNIPVGKNGLKKKRVMKSRTTQDAKGFIGAAASSLCFPCD